MRLKASSETLLYSWVALTLKNLKANIDQLQANLDNGKVEKGFEEMTLDLIKEQQEAIDENLIKITESTTDLMIFSFYLRKIDPADYFSKQFLGKFVSSNLLYQIIMMNKWNEKEDKMDVAETGYVKLTIGQEKDGVLRYSTNKDT